MTRAGGAAFQNSRMNLDHIRALPNAEYCHFDIVNGTPPPFLTLLNDTTSFMELHRLVNGTTHRGPPSTCCRLTSRVKRPMFLAGVHLCGELCEAFVNAFNHGAASIVS